MTLTYYLQKGLQLKPHDQFSFFHILQRYIFHVVKGMQNIHVVQTYVFHVLTTFSLQKKFHVP